MHIDRFPWGKMVWHLDQNEREKFGNSTARMTINPDQSANFHMHDNADELIFCEHGSLNIHFETETISLKENEHFIIPSNTPHFIANPFENIAIAFLIYNHHNRTYKPLKKAVKQ
jgi:mannose-6-phosphate isomerase-like protein (cupin superfamily)